MLLVHKPHREARHQTEPLFPVAEWLREGAASPSIWGRSEKASLRRGQLGRIIKDEPFVREDWGNGMSKARAGGGHDGRGCGGGLP